MSNSFLTPIVLLVASVGLFFGFIDKEFVTKKDLTAQVTVYEEALQNAKALKVKEAELQQKLLNIGDQNIKDLEKILPDSVDTVRMIMDLNGIASRYGILIKTIKIGEVDKNATTQTPALGEVSKPQPSYNTTTLTFTVTTTYEKFSAFLKDVEKSLRIFDVSTISLKPGKDSGTVYDFSVAAKTYSLK